VIQMHFSEPVMFLERPALLDAEAAWSAWPWAASAECGVEMPRWQSGSSGTCNRFVRSGRQANKPAANNASRVVHGCTQYGPAGRLGAVQHLALRPTEGQVGERGAGLSAQHLHRLGAVVGVSNLHVYAAMKGLPLEEFLQTRNAPTALYSVAAVPAS